MEISYVDIMWRYHVEISYGDVIYDTRSFMVSVALRGDFLFLVIVKVFLRFLFFEKRYANFMV